jgi:nucleotide-binding universal stress UspA family protein
MTIVCGTDFSAHAGTAATVAAALARRMRQPLQLVHVREAITRQQAVMKGAAAHLAPPSAALHQEAERLRDLGIRVEERMEIGLPDEGLVAQAAARQARLLVLGPLGRRAPSQWLLGSTAERVARTAGVPTLVARSAAPFRSWLQGRRRLRVLIGADQSTPAKAALRWAAELGRLGPCSFTIAHVVFPPADYVRLGVAPFAEPRLDRNEVEQVLAREIEQSLPKWPRGCEAHVRIVTGFGPAADHLVQLAIDERADLIIVGTHQRSGANRIWHGAVSAAVLRKAPMSVACVPVPADESGLPETPHFRRVLVPTDLSALSNRAAAYAYAAAEPGAEVCLMHVLSPSPAGRGRQRRLAAKQQLEKLVAGSAARRGIATTFELAVDRSVAGCICATAERLNVDLICISSHGRSGLAKTLAGSVATRVLTDSRRPLLVIRPPRGD